MTQLDHDGWETMETAPKDGSIVELTWMEDGVPQEIWVMRWDADRCNGMFPGRVGFWTTTDGNLTWNDDDPDGAPTHWRRPRYV